MNNPGAHGAIRQYQQVGVHSSLMDASPHHLIQLLMAGALDKIAIAKGCLERGAVSDKGNHITLAISIVDGLRSSLDHEKGGEVAANLKALYDYMERRLFEANLQNDIAILDEVTALLKEIKAGWDAIPEEFRGARPAADAPAE